MNDEGTVRVRFGISGTVQGVHFRSSTCREAGRLGLAGFVRNEPDGSVMVEAEGPADAVDDLARFMINGPGKARVESIRKETLSVIGDREFLVSFHGR